MISFEDCDLKAAFSPEFEKAWYRTQLLKIRQTGTLDAYIAEFRSLCMLAPEVDELTKAILFTEGLKQKQRQLVKQVHAETLQAAVKAARSAADDEGRSGSHARTRRTQHAAVLARARDFFATVSVVHVVVNRWGSG